MKSDEKPPVFVAFSLHGRASDRKSAPLGAPLDDMFSRLVFGRVFASLLAPFWEPKVTQKWWGEMHFWVLNLTWLFWCLWGTPGLPFGLPWLNFGAKMMPFHRQCAWIPLLLVPQMQGSPP